MPRISTQENLINKIETIRKEMIQTGIQEGLSSKRTIELSQLLDQYVLQYQKQTYKAYNKLH